MRRAWMAFACVALFACAETGDREGAGGASTIDWSTSASTATGTSSANGGGGASAASGGSGGGYGGAATGGAGGQGGALATSTLILLAAGATGALGAEYQAGGWDTDNLAQGTSDGISLALASGEAVGVLRDGSNGSLRYVTWTGSWSAFADVAVSVTTRAAPHALANGGEVRVVFHGDDFKHYFAIYDSVWSPTAEAVTADSVQSFGPSPAALASLAADSIIAQAGNDSKLYAQARSGGLWQSAVQVAGSNVAMTPAIVALSSGAELLAVYVDASNARLAYVTRTSGNWSAPADVDALALSGQPPSLLALAGGEALLAFRGQDGKPYWSRYAGASWTAPAAVVTVNPTVVSAPALAPGIDGSEAELAFIDDADDAAYHTRLIGGAWSAPVLVGGASLTHVAIASE